ncbi:MAG: YicC family protein [Chromatiales bacterium]|nr:YicC family protein [Chromatiales bacterium]
MVRSMTGFARAETSAQGCQLLWEMRSVNHRYMEVQLRLPEGLRHLEAPLRERASSLLGRGRVEATLGLRRSAETGGSLQLNQELVRQLAAQAREVAAIAGDSAPLNPLELMRWNGVLEQPVPDEAALAPAAIAGFEEALAGLAMARSSEGARLAELLEQRCVEIERLVLQVRTRLPEVLPRIRERMRERIAGLDVEANPERLEQELALVAQKLDVSEELDRLESHLVEVRTTLAADEPVGRRLDFLVQELNREANTLASKSADTRTSAQAVDLKVLIEQMREQVQNIE